MAVPQEPDEFPPPWIALPGFGPDDPATQGLAEAYIVLNWLPFWQSLNPGQKRDYLDRWRASAEWREAIATRYDWDPVQMAEEARESAEALAIRGPYPRHRPWWRRWWRS